MKDGKLIVHMLISIILEFWLFCHLTLFHSNVHMSIFLSRPSKGLSEHMVQAK